MLSDTDQFLLILKHGADIKIHEAIAFTATAPLLNLNLNYEKLRGKVNELYEFNKSYDTNLCIF